MVSPGGDLFFYRGLLTRLTLLSPSKAPSVFDVVHFSLLLDLCTMEKIGFSENFVKSFLKGLPFSSLFVKLFHPISATEAMLSE